MPDKSGSNRIGWNQRGPTVRDQLKNALHQSGIANPDSDYWETRAFKSKDFLCQCMGNKEFEEWAERMFPGDTIDQATWKEIHEAYDMKFQRIQAEIAMVDDHDRKEDPKHIKTNGVY